jgi:hypothetical protein
MKQSVKDAIDRADGKDVALRDSRGRLLAGHAPIKGAGRPSGRKNFSVRSLAELTGVNPFQISLEILRSQHLPSLPGSTEKGRMVTTAEYVKILTEIQCYLAPKMQATALTGNEGGPVAVASLDVTSLMASPELARAAQLLALGIAQQPQLPAGDSDDSGRFLYEDPDPTTRR